MLSENVIFEHLLPRLSPWENLIIKIQVILTWQSPIHSLVYLGFVEIILLYACFINNNSLFMFLCFAWILLFLDCIHNYIWPTIKLPEITDYLEPWTSMSPQVMNVHEITRQLSKYISLILRQHHAVARFRQEKRLAFGIIASICLSFIAYFGTFIWGRTLFFLTFNLALALPAMIHFKVHEQLYKYVEPFCLRVRQTLDQHEKSVTETAEKEEAQFHPDFKHWQRVVESELDPEKSDHAEDDYLDRFIPPANEGDHQFSIEEDDQLASAPPLLTDGGLDTDEDDEVDDSFEFVDYKP